MTAGKDEGPGGQARQDHDGEQDRALDKTCESSPARFAANNPQAQGLFERSVRAAHRGYKVTLSPFFGQSCRFLPTCSDYGRDALIQHGPVRGGWLTVRRVCKCHPFGGSGYDPVPPAPSGAEKTK